MFGPEVPIVLIVFGFVFSTIYIIVRHKERMAVMAKGLSTDEIKAMYTREIRHDPLSSLKWGILLLLAGVAIMLGNYLHYHYDVDEGAVVGLVILFVGIGLVAFYGIAAKKINQ